MTLEQALSQLQSLDPEARERAVRWLRVHGGPNAVHALVAALDDPDDDVLVRATMALGEMKVREAVLVLIERAQSDRRPEERRLYIESLGEIGDPVAVPALVAALDDADVGVAESACGALAELSDPVVVPPLIRALSHSHEAVVRRACAALSEELDDPRAVEPLLRLLDDPRWSVRYAACRALLELKVTDTRLDAALERLTRDPEGERHRHGLRWMRRQLAQVRGADSSEAHAAEEREEEQRVRAMVVAALADPDPKVRSRAIQPVWGFAGRESVDLLIGAMDDPAAEVRSNAAYLLGQMQATEALPVLVQHALSDKAMRTRQSCAKQLYKFTDERAVDALIQLLGDADELMLLIATNGLHHASSVDARAIPALLPLLEHSDRAVRFNAALVLLELKAADSRLVAALEQLSVGPEAEEHDLEAAEWNCNLEKQRRLYRESRLPDPEPAPAMRDLVEEARRFLAREES